VGRGETLEYPLKPGVRYLINPGSVGQPRDGDWRACYVLLDGPRVTFRRIEYDVDQPVRKIHAVPELDNMLGDRLRQGR
jgi:diadenosine tetraphosphatase ApaH/serine/threonine PP2A family protein phosphatase